MKGFVKYLLIISIFGGFNGIIAADSSNEQPATGSDAQQELRPVQVSRRMSFKVFFAPQYTDPETGKTEPSEPSDQWYYQVRVEADPNDTVGQLKKKFFEGIGLQADSAFKYGNEVDSNLSVDLTDDTKSLSDAYIYNHSWIPVSVSKEYFQLLKSKAEAKKELERKQMEEFLETYKARVLNDTEQNINQLLSFNGNTYEKFKLFFKDLAQFVMIYEGKIPNFGGFSEIDTTNEKYQKIKGSLNDLVVKMKSELGTIKPEVKEKLIDNFEDQFRQFFKFGVVTKDMMKNVPDNMVLNMAKVMNTLMTLLYTNIPFAQWPKNFTRLYNLFIGEAKRRKLANVYDKGLGL